MSVKHTGVDIRWLPMFEGMTTIFNYMYHTAIRAGIHNTQVKLEGGNVVAFCRYVDTLTSNRFHNFLRSLLTDSNAKTILDKYSDCIHELETADLTVEFANNAHLLNQVFSGLSSKNRVLALQFLTREVRLNQHIMNKASFSSRFKKIRRLKFEIEDLYVISDIAIRASALSMDTYAVIKILQLIEDSCPPKKCHLFFNAGTLHCERLNRFFYLDLQWTASLQVPANYKSPTRCLKLK